MVRNKYDLNAPVLLITGCIEPIPNQMFLVLKDKNERLRQYIDSIKFYIASSNLKKIVYCDNSDYHYSNMEELNQLAVEYGKEFEWLNFHGDKNKILECGKGWGEGEIIEYAMSNSRLLKTSETFIKVTGRLKVKNINKIIKHIKERVNYFNRDIYRGHGIDTRFYICDIDFYLTYLRDAYKNTLIGDKIIALEDVFFNKLGFLGKYRSTYFYPVFEGVSGGNGRDYSVVPNWKISIYSLFCYINTFNYLYPIVLAFKKIKLIVTNTIKGKD